MTYHVQFPGLGLEFTLDRVAFTVFGMPIYWYGILIATGLALAIVFAFSHALISNGFLRAKIFVVFIIMIVFSFNAAKLRKNNHNDFIECFKNFIKFILLPKLPPIQYDSLIFINHKVHTNLFHGFAS